MSLIEIKKLTFRLSFSIIRFIIELKILLLKLSNKLLVIRLIFDEWVKNVWGRAIKTWTRRK